MGGEYHVGICVRFRLLARSTLCVTARSTHPALRCVPLVHTSRPNASPSNSSSANEPRRMVVGLSSDLRVRMAMDRLATHLGAGLMVGNTVESLRSLFEAEPDTAQHDHIVVKDWHNDAGQAKALAEHFTRNGRNLPHVALVAPGDVGHCVQAMRYGALEALELHAADDLLHSALVHAVERTRGAREQARVADQELVELRRRFATLRDKERETLLEMVGGTLNKQAAHKLGIAERTVKKHRASVLKRMGAGSIPVLVRMALRLGLIP